MDHSAQYSKTPKTKFVIVCKSVELLDSGKEGSETEGDHKLWCIPNSILHAYCLCHHIAIGDTLLSKCTTRILHRVYISRAKKKLVFRDSPCTEKSNTLCMVQINESLIDLALAI